jgi:preprotein translocase subunit SecG
MSSVLLVIHLIIAIALVATVLLQRSEGGALGMGGGGGGGGGLFTGRGAANVLTRVTAVLAGLFFVTSILLTLLARGDGSPQSILDAITPGSKTESTADKPSGSILPQLPASEAEPVKPEAPTQN